MGAKRTEDVQEDAYHCARTARQIALASATPSAKSEVGLNRQAPPCVPSYRLIVTGHPVSSGFCRNLLTDQCVAAHGKTAYPIVTFDKTDRTTLESFNSLAGRTDCGACARCSDQPEHNAKSDDFPACGLAIAHDSNEHRRSEFYAARRVGTPPSALLFSAAVLADSLE
jgi:hypothetical protein